MEKLIGLKIAICQMNVIPGRPDLNAGYMINKIYLAAKNGNDVIVFPEMCVPGYMIGDRFEDTAFIADVQIFNKKICDAAKEAGVVVIFGTVIIDRAMKRGEDGRQRKYNGALIAGGGAINHVIKTLQPNYRIFDDDRHFYSGRKAFDGHPKFMPIEIETKIGKIKIGIILCEDMWHEDYPLNPTEELVKNGAEMILNLSASPWTWQKNRKRHKVVKGLLDKNPVPFVYVNNTGIQNTGKNIIIFDGSSTIYGKNGEIIFEIPPHESGVRDFVFDGNEKAVISAERGDTKELYEALKCAIGEFIKTFPPHMRKVVVGLSGGIDSALSATLFADVLGPENVIAVNMPSQYNSQKTRDVARDIAKNLDVKYEIVPIRDSVDMIAKASGIQTDTLAYENIQARIRMEFLAARAQDVGGVFSCNSNKVEMALGYGTLYGDVAGFLAPLGDLVKREEYQLADYMNREVYKREVIPSICMTMTPTAELKEDQKDPFDYGNLDRRGYHDEMVRAFVEFRRNPEWFLEQYAKGVLEKELMLEQDTLQKLFGSEDGFIRDLEKNWNRFNGSYFKRIQSAPIPIVSKRAFGTDLREAILSTYFTQRYHDLKKMILARQSAKKKIAVYGGSFNPPGKHHRQIVKTLVKNFDKVIVFPCGYRKDKASVGAIWLGHRKNLVLLAFSGIEKVEFDFSDLDNDTFTPTYQVDKRFKDVFPEAQICHVVGADIVAGGRANDSEIHRTWDKGCEIWRDLNFVVLTRPGYDIEPHDLPASAEIVDMGEIYGSGTMIRLHLRNKKPISHLVDEEVEKYINKNNLYE